MTEAHEVMVLDIAGGAVAVSSPRRTRRAPAAPAQRLARRRAHASAARTRVVNSVATMTTVLTALTRGWHRLWPVQSWSFQSSSSHWPVATRWPTRCS